YLAALAIYPAIGARLGEANVQKALGDLEMREANLKGARERYLAALAIYPAIGARLGEANVLQKLGDLGRAEGNLEQAWEYFRMALALHTAIHNQMGVAAVLIYMGRTANAAANYVQAVLLLDEALSIYHVITDRFGEMLSLDDQGDAFQALELAEAALGAWWQAFVLAQAIGDSTAQRLAGIFSQLAQQMGDEEWRQLATDLATHAEEWRQAGVATVRAQTNDQA
ncbi:MAG: hypothetical protein DYG89_17090, partial [Caldilinea sp. CFX5]|nr:hypothetical protein [Caldilinea sp. CFX5]